MPDEPRFHGDPLTRTERAALIQANLQRPQTNHHSTCRCAGCEERRGA